MEINKSGATFSSIVGIGAKIKKISEETGQEYLFLNRGVNAVCNIDLTEVIKQIDFNSVRIQVYPPNKGTLELRQAINEEYFAGKSDVENMSITPGGMPAIDLTVQTLKLSKLYYAKYFWGSYSKLATIRNIPSESYEDLESLIEFYQRSKARSSGNIAVLICDPNNPVGDKMDDKKLLTNIKKLNSLGIIVMFDSPYRKIFYEKDDTLFQELLKLENVIITESFSKTFGLSGQRIGFIHSTNRDFNEELNIRLLYSANGVNAFAQELVHKLLSTPEGKKAASDFKRKTVKDIEQNIKYLETNSLLVDTLYKDTKPVGIFAVVNRSEAELLKYRIGSVGMNYFTHNKDQQSKETSRICVSVPHEKFKKYFSEVVSNQKEIAFDKLGAFGC